MWDKLWLKAARSTRRVRAFRQISIPAAMRYFWITMARVVREAEDVFAGTLRPVRPVSWPAFPRDLVVWPDLWRVAANGPGNPRPRASRGGPR
jgi:hypothetical protein